MRISKKILAFSHIEKAAGQTLTRILENNFSYKHCRVAPLKKEHNGIFTANAMETVFRINPFVEAISGHSIQPSSDLQTSVTNVRYITLLRNPMERYVSHYQYWVKKMKKDIKFIDFIKLECMCNFQTKKIAGTPDVDKAKKVLNEKVFLVGTVEDFDDFLTVLKAKTEPLNLDFRYYRKNVAKDNTIKNYIYENIANYRKQIIENNLLDIELYDYVKNDIFQKEKKMIDISYKSTWQVEKSNSSLQIKRAFIGKLYRNLYFGPLIKIMRYKNGLEMGGSY